MPTTFTIATWNVENLFRPPANAPQAQRATYDAKLGFLARTIQAMDPDVIALQEVGGDDALTDLRLACGAAYDHQRRGVPDSRGIAVAFLSKQALTSPVDIVDFPAPVTALGFTDLDGRPLARMGRGGLRVRVTKAGFKADLVAVHLKSKLLSFPRPGGGSAFSTKDETLRAQVAALALARRTAEAAAVRMAVNAIVVDNDVRALAVLGDFNDVPSAATSQIFQGPDGSELDTRGFDRPDEGDDARLWNLAPRIAEARRFSRIHRGQGELIDQIFCSQEFFPFGNDQTRRLPVRVDALVESIRSIGDDPNARSDEPHPDHAPLVAVFELD